VREIAVERLADLRIVVDDEDAPHGIMARRIVNFG